MVAITQGLGVQIHPKDINCPESWTYDAFFDSLINSDSINQDSVGGSSSRTTSLADEDFAKNLNLQLQNAHEENQNTRLETSITAATIKSDEQWIEALAAFNYAASNYAASSSATDYGRKDFSLADDAPSVSPGSPQIELHAPQNSHTNSPCSTPSHFLSFNIESLYVHDTKRRSSPPPQFTQRAALSNEAVTPSVPMMNVLSQYSQSVPWNMFHRPEAVYNHGRVINSGANLLPTPSNLDMANLKFDPSDLSPGGYTQHPNTPVVSSPNMSQRSTSSMAALPMDVPPQEPVQSFPMTFPHVNPQAVMSQQPTPPTEQSYSWGMGTFGTGQSEFRGSGSSNEPNNKAEAGWSFDNESTLGAQNPNSRQLQNQRGRTTTSSNFPKMELAIEGPDSGVMGMPSTGMPVGQHGIIMDARNMTRPNHSSPVNSASASSTSRSCPSLLDPLSAHYSELAAPQKSQAHAHQPQSWSPSSHQFSVQPQNAMNLPTPNPSRNSGTATHPKITDTRPVSLTISNNGGCSPIPCRSPVHGSGKNNQLPTRRCKSSGHHRRKSSYGGGSTSPRHASDGFVNYTPLHSEIILNGVAPSGSSKTKAKREREEKEKRRKFGEAAEKLVLQAGGDLRIVEQGLQALKSST